MGRGYKEQVVNVDGIYFKMSHFPSNRGNWVGWMIHGHVHNRRPFIDYRTQMINVSVDATGFKPVRFSEIIKRIKRPK